MEKSCLTSTSGERPRTPRIEFHVTKPMRSYYITRTTRIYIHLILINYTDPVERIVSLIN